MKNVFALVQNLNKQRRNSLKKKLVKTISIALVIITVFSSISILASAAVSWPSFSTSKPIKAYTISTGNNTTSYSSASLSSKKGTVFASDEIHIYQIGTNSSGRYVAYCSYPISNGRKYAYIPLSAVTTAKAPSASYTSKANLTTYRRSGSSATAGSISKGDKVYRLATSGSWTQVLYNIGSASNPSGWRMAWISTANFNKYINGSSSNANTSAAVNATISAAQKAAASSNGDWKSPMKNMYCTWRTPGNNMSWAQYTYRNSSRTYHLGIDVYGTNGNVYSTYNGTVAACSSSPSGANGRYIIIKHVIGGKTVYSFYAHLEYVRVSKGQSVSAGEYIGIAGNSGTSSNGKHLHFAIVDTLWSNGTYYGYATPFSGNKCTYGGVTYYNPWYVINYDRLP